MDYQTLPESDCLEGAPHPRFTNQIFGQEPAIEKFITAANSDRILHAWLITGPKGVGKATLAWKIAKFLLVHGIQHQSNKNADSQFKTIETDTADPIVGRISAMSEPSLSLVRRMYIPDRKRFKTQIGVEEIRTLSNQLSLFPTGNQPMVAIIDSADDMNNFAANALLKLLEEPPRNSYLFLISHSPDKLLPTILSRCGILRCSALEPANLKSAVEATGAFQVEDEVSLTELSGGSVGDSIRLHANEGIDNYSQLINIISSIPKAHRSEFYSLASKCGGLGTEIQYSTTVTSILLLLGRLAKVTTGTQLGEAVPGEKECLSKLGSFQPADVWSSLYFDLANKSQHAILVNLDPVSVVLDMLFSIENTARSIQQDF